MKSDARKVLVLCTGNSCRSAMAEALINDLGQGRYRAWSAGNVPAATVHPKSIETLRRHSIDPGHPRSKSWYEFAEQSFDLVITVCDQAAGESCTLFPGKPQETALECAGPGQSHWIVRDIDAAFEKVFLCSRIASRMNCSKPSTPRVGHAGERLVPTIGASCLIGQIAQGI